MKRLAVLLFLVATPAAAHHPLGGAPMETFAHGLMSGIGHPVLGFDHLFFVLAAGLAARLAGLPYTAPLAYLVAMLGGCALHYAGTTLPLVETGIALSLLVMGAILAGGRDPSARGLMILFAVFGLAHGAGLGTGIAAQEGGVSTAVLSGYLIGLGVVQYALAVAAGGVAGWLGVVRPTDMSARLAGAAVAGIGAFLILEILEGPLVALLAA